MTSIRPTVSLNDAESYFATRLRSDSWSDAAETDKAKALAQASYLISGAFVFTESAWELAGDEIVWDDRVIAAICEEAIWLLERDPSEIPEALLTGILSASAGSVSATFDKTHVVPWICPTAKILIGDLGAFIGDGGEGDARATVLPL